MASAALELIERPDHVVGREIFAVVEGHTLGKREGVDGAVVAHLRQCREAGSDLAGLVGLEQRLVDVVEQHLIERRAGGGDQVEARGLEHRTDHDRITGGLGGRFGSIRRGGGVGRGRVGG